MTQFPDRFSLLKELSETPGVSGREELVRRRVMNELRPLMDEVFVDGMGNVIGRLDGSDPSAPVVVVDAHIDEIGFVVKSIDSNGFIRFIARGGFDPKTVVSQTVTLYLPDGTRMSGIIGSKAIHLMSPEERNKKTDLSDLFIDVGLPVEEVKRRVAPGTPVAMDGDLRQIGNLFCGKALDNRVSVFAVIEAIRNLGGRQPSTIYVVGSCQEEVGLRGAQGFAGDFSVDIALVIDVTHGTRIPGIAEVDRVTVLGEGVAIGIQDGSCIFHPGLVTALQELAQSNGLPYQLQVKDKGGTNGGALQRYGGSVPTCALGIPLRYMHSVVETIHPDDVEGAIGLLVAFLQNAHTLDLSLA